MNSLHEVIAAIESLTARVADLERQIESGAPAEVAGPAHGQFYEAAGVLWRRQANGAFEDLAYCPVCQFAMGAFPPGSNEELICGSCHFRAPFRPAELKAKKPAS